MKPHTIILTAVTAFIVMSAPSYVGSVHAQPIAPVATPTPPPPPPVPRRTAPTTLDATKRLARFNQALKSANLPLVAALSPPEMRLTPVSPQSQGGAIHSAAPISFSGASSDEPEGSYLVGQAQGMGMSQITLKFPTVPNKNYLLDCRFASASTSSMKLSFSQPSGTVTAFVEDGHVIDATQATSSSLTVMIVLSRTDGHPTWPVGHFYGCEITKV